MSSSITLANVERNWPNKVGYLKSLEEIRGDNLSSATSKAGDGMLFLQGIEVKVGDGWLRAHIALPPNKDKLGYVDEGHLKIEEGKLLNQYFFQVGEEVSKLSNSLSVKTKNPGDWSQLGDELWNEFKMLSEDILEPR